MSCMRARRGVTEKRLGTELIGEGYYVYCGGFKAEKGSCSGGGQRGEDVGFGWAADDGE